MGDYILSLDIGGTSIKSALIEQNSITKELRFVESSYLISDSKAMEKKETVIRNFIDIFLKHTKQIKDEKSNIICISLAFPGPFNYEEGICLIKNLDKFESLFNVNITNEIRKELAVLKNSKLPADIPLVYENDAVAFALGEYKYGKAKNFNKAMFITLGTGCGSCFIEDSCVVKGKYFIPNSGFIFKETFKESIIDDYISKRKILEIAKKYGFDINIYDIKEMQEFALAKDLQAKKVFDEFGKILASALKKYIDSFNPDILVLGGRISNAFNLMKESFYNELHPLSIKVDTSKDLSKSALIGIAAYSQKFI